MAIGTILRAPWRANCDTYRTAGALGASCLAAASGVFLFGNATLIAPSTPAPPLRVSVSPAPAPICEACLREAASTVGFGMDRIIDLTPISAVSRPRMPVPVIVTAPRKPPVDISSVSRNDKPAPPEQQARRHGPQPRQAIADARVEPDKLPVTPPFEIRY